MQNCTCLCFLIGTIICSIAASLDASSVDRFKGSGYTLDSVVLLLGSDTPWRQQSAVSAIKEMNVPDDRILLEWARLSRLLSRGGMFERLEDSCHWVRMRDAVFRLIDLDKALGNLLHAVKSGDTDESILAQYVIEEIAGKLRTSELEPRPKTVPLLAEALTEQHAEIRLIASVLLSDIPSHAKDAVPALIGALGDEDREVRSAAVYALGRTAAANPDVQPEIIETLISRLGDPPVVIFLPRRRNSNSHVDAAAWLASMGDAAVPALLDALNTTSTAARHHAAIALAKTGPEHAATTIPILTEALASPHPATRYTVIYTFAELAKQPTLTNQILQALAQVLEASGDTVENRVARPEATSALTAIAFALPTAKPEIIETLIAALDTPNFVCGYFDYDTDRLSNFHAHVADQLMMMGPAAAPSLLNALNSADAGVRHHAAIALAKIGSEHAATAMPVLIEALASPHLATRAEAVLALQRLAEEPALAGRITPVLVKVLETTTYTEAIYYDLTFHELVADALAHINLLAITEQLQSENPYVQRLAATAIAQISNAGIDDPETNRRIIEILAPIEDMHGIEDIRNWLWEWQDP